MSDPTAQAPPPSLSFDLAIGGGTSVLLGLFTRGALKCGAVHFQRIGWRIDRAELPILGEVIASEMKASSETRLISWRGALILISFFPSGLPEFDAVLAAPDRAILECVTDELRGLLPEARPPEDRKVDIHFWSGGNQVASISKRLPVDPWTEIEPNYAATTRRDLTALMRDFRPGEGGQLLLWHGEPGTGKTFALRTLAWEWRSWCEAHYVIDPEVLLGESSYLVRVLFNASSRFDDGSRTRIARETGSRWRLLILEDCGELLAADAKAATGQALSRLLNLTDGLIGVGFRTLVLISTNDPIKKMHPAVTREGREAARVGFERHSREEAREWLDAHDVDEEPVDGLTLAGLYAMAAGKGRKKARRSVGFAA